MRMRATSPMPIRGPFDMTLDANVESNRSRLASSLGAMGAIFCISLFASSFPTLSKRVSFLRIPRVVFFIGKHFGTGVILSTAFVHLLQDAFEALLDPGVKQQARGVAKWAGLIVLGSLLAIFLVEYISTAYVDRLQSQPGTPNTEHANGHAGHTHDLSALENDHEDPADCPGSPLSSSSCKSHPPRSNSEATIRPSPNVSHHPSENTPLLPSRSGSYAHSVSHLSPHSRAHPHPHAHAHGSGEEQNYFEGHHRHEPRGAHAHHHERTPRLPADFASALSGPSGDSEDVRKAAIRRASALVKESVRRMQARRSSSSSSLKGRPATPRLDEEQEQDRGSDAEEYGPEEFGQGLVAGIGHFHRHGETRAEDGQGLADQGRSDAGAATDMDHSREHSHHHHHHHHSQGEGNGHASHHDEEEARESHEVDQVRRERQVIGILVLQLGIMLHSLVIGLTLAIASGPEFTSLVAAVSFHQLFEGLSLGIRISSLPAPSNGKSRTRGALKPILAFLFSITVPSGIAVGLLAFGSRGSMSPHMKLSQGIMSAISAGMLIYAACVEMLAGDFISDPLLWRSPLTKQALALGSLFLGVGSMAIIGIWD